MSLVPTFLRSNAASKRATSTLTADLESEANSEVSGQTFGASAFALNAHRTAVAGRHVSNRKAARLMRAVQSERRQQSAQNDWQARQFQTLEGADYRARLAATQSVSRFTYLVGFVGYWVPKGLILLLFVAMLINDPLFVLSSMRKALDVSDSTPILPLKAIGTQDGMNALIAFATAVGLSSILIATVSIGGKALGTVLFRGALLKDSESFPEVVRISQKFPSRYLWAIGVLAILMLSAFSVFLAFIAKNRFSGGIFSSANDSDAIKVAITMYLAILPFIILVLEVISSAPQVAHSGKVSAWHLRTKVREAYTIRIDQLLLARLHRAGNRVGKCEIGLRDSLGLVGLRSQAEVLDAAHKTGRVDLAQYLQLNGMERMAGPMGSATLDAHQDEGADGGINTGFLSTPPVSVLVARALAAFENRNKTSECSLLPDRWKKLRDETSPASKMGEDSTGAQTLSPEALDGTSTSETETE